jgi:hypothetical protein
MSGNFIKADYGERNEKKSYGGIITNARSARAKADTIRRKRCTTRST